MKMNTIVLIAITLIVIAAGLWYWTTSDSMDKVMKDSSDMAMMDKDYDDQLESENMMEGSAGSYEKYDSAKLAKAESGDVILFFRASWCPSCIALDTDIKNSLRDIPADVTILEVDYDNSTELKQKYGVTYQHTFVQVNEDGNELKQWSSSPTLESLLEEVI